MPMLIDFAMKLVLRESKSDNNHNYTKLLLPISPVEVLLSPITHIHGSYKFVIDSVLLFLPRRLLEKRNLIVRDLYQHIIPLNWIQEWDPRLTVSQWFPL